MELGVQQRLTLLLRHYIFILKTNETSDAMEFPRMTISSIGNLGVGTTDPQNTLTVNGDLWR